MQITITGPRGCGSSSVAAQIGRLLRDRGMGVRFVSHSPQAADTLECASRNDWPTPIVPQRVTIVDGVEQEDERAILRRMQQLKTAAAG